MIKSRKLKCRNLTNFYLFFFSLLIKIRFNGTSTVPPIRWNKSSNSSISSGSTTATLNDFKNNGFSIVEKKENRNS